MVKNYTKYIKEAYKSEYNINDVDIGDRVKITDDLMDWVHKYRWGSGMIDTIGKICTVINITDCPSLETCQVTIRSDDPGLNYVESWWFPIQCMVSVEKEKPIVRWYHKGKLEKEK